MLLKNFNKNIFTKKENKKMSFFEMFVSVLLNINRTAANQTLLPAKKCWCQILILRERNFQASWG